MVGAVAVTEVREGSLEVPGVAPLGCQPGKGGVQRGGSPGAVVGTGQLLGGFPGPRAGHVGREGSCWHAARCYRCRSAPGGGAVTARPRATTVTRTSTVGKDRSQVLRSRSLTTRLVLAGALAVGAGLTVLSARAEPAGAAPAPLTLSESWNGGAGVILNDAPCGVALASPIEFHDGATAAVEVGDRSGHLYGLALANGAVAPGWGSGTGAVVGPGQGCTASPSGGTPATGIDGIEVPGSPPIDSTSSVTGSGALTFGGGNAAAPVDGGYSEYATDGTLSWNQVVTNPPTDTAPAGGVQASLPVTNLGTVVEGGSLGQETSALNAADGSTATGWPQFSADSVFSTAAAG